MIPAIRKKEQIGDLLDYEIEYGEKLYDTYLNVRCEHNYGRSLEPLQGTLYCTNYKLILKPSN